MLDWRCLAGHPQEYAVADVLMSHPGSTREIPHSSADDHPALIAIADSMLYVSFR
jgi:hypothetical protein